MLVICRLLICNKLTLTALEYHTTILKVPIDINQSIHILPTLWACLVSFKIYVFWMVFEYMYLAQINSLKLSTANWTAVWVYITMYS